jgi:hypothetical protein
MHILRVTQDYIYQGYYVQKNWTFIYWELNEQINKRQFTFFEAVTQHIFY